VEVPSAAAQVLRPRPSGVSWADEVRVGSERDMRLRVHVEDSDEMLPEYDFSGAVRGKYYKRYHVGTNVVLLDADVAEVFPNSASVNEALRLLVSLADAVASRAQATARRPKSRRKNARRSPQTRAARGRE